MSDEAYMARALRLAALGRGWTNPNPMVGAIIVSGTHVLAEGYHHRYGDLHAERDALKSAMRKGLDVVSFLNFKPFKLYFTNNSSPINSSGLFSTQILDPCSLTKSQILFNISL